ncbi:hypothetical protein ACFLSW_04220 [Candidatus Bipolaricaulota bacterium]
MKIRNWNVLALMLALCLVLAACGSNDAPDAASTPDPAPVAAADTADATPTAPAPVADAVEPTAIEVDLPTEQPEPSEPDVPLELDVDVEVDIGIDLTPEGIFAGATAALEALDSYRFTTSFLFAGEEDGTFESGSIELSGEIMDSERKHFTWRNLEDGEQFEIIQLEDQAWMYNDGEWESVPTLVADAMSQAVLIFAPSVAWGGLFGSLDTQSDYVGPETIDGIAAHHYTSTYQQWGGYWYGELLDASGDVWIAEAGYPLRYDFTASGVDEDGNRGSISWTMELTDVGEEIIIVPPL